MFRTDAALMFSHFFEYETILKLRLLVKDDVYMQISITDVAIA
jgi:hypothetical protein